MPNLSKQVSTRQAKMEWLANNRHLWLFKSDAELRNHKVLNPIADQMKQEGLYSKETYNYDICFSIRKMIHEIKQGAIA